MTTDEEGRTIREVEFDDSGDVLRDLRPATRKVRKTTARKVRKTVKKKTTKKKTARKRGKPKIYTEPRMQMQVRVGAKLIANMNAAVEILRSMKPEDKKAEQGEESRTSFVVRAINRRLDDPSWRPGRTTADVLVGNRTPLLIRLPRDRMPTVDAACEEAGLTRTVWLLDAILAELALVRRLASESAESAAQAA